MLHYKFFQNRECEFYPCHKIDSIDEFNCLFCYCPLYHLGKDCDGDYLYLDNRIKSCENCVKPHVKSNYDMIIDKISQNNP